MSKKYFTIIVGIILIVVVGGIYWWNRGDALLVQPLTGMGTIDIHILPVELKPADSQTPRGPRCDPVVSQTVVINITDGIPVCVMATTKQFLQFRNLTRETIKFQFIANIEIRPGQIVTISNPMGNYLAPGVHSIPMDYYIGKGPTVWVLSFGELREACAHSEISLQGEKDTAVDTTSGLAVVRWTDKDGAYNVVPLIYEPETDFAGCSESAKLILRHIQKTVIPQ